MINNYKIITLCGSTKFKDEFIKAQKELTLQGNIVISVGLFGHADGDYQTILTDEIKIMLDDMHKRKIDLADEIYVINKSGYIGKSTRSEIEYAKSVGKIIRYLEKVLICDFGTDNCIHNKDGCCTHKETIDSGEDCFSFACWHNPY